MKALIRERKNTFRKAHWRLVAKTVVGYCSTTPGHGTWCGCYPCMPFSSLSLWEKLQACSWELTICNMTPASFWGCYKLTRTDMPFSFPEGNDRSWWKVMDCDLNCILIGAKLKNFWFIIIAFLQILPLGIKGHTFFMCFPTVFFLWVFFFLFELIL